MRAAVKCFLLIALGLFAGCATPKVQPIPAAQVIRSDLLSFLREGTTTREEVLLKLGTPSMRFEGERILTYQVRIDKDGAAHVFWPRRSELELKNSWLTHWEPGIHSLVLVFGPNGVLEKYSLVGAK